MMESNSSSEEISSSECETESSCEDDSENLETTRICGATLQLPQGLCENREIFKELFSTKTWNSLSEINKQHLKNFLPHFPDNDDQEKNVTLQMLFGKEKFRFNSPLFDFHDKLKAGCFRPDIAKMRSLMKKTQRKECKYQQKRYFERLLRDLLTSRQRLLDLSHSLPPGVEPRIDRPAATNPCYDCPAAQRTKRRYFQELMEIKALVGENGELSEDENYPEGPPVQLSRKQRRHLNGLQHGNSLLSPGPERVVTSTLSNKPQGMDLEHSITSTHNPYQLNEESYRSLLLRHRKRKLDNDANPELITKGISVKDIAQRAQLTPSKRNGKPHVTADSNKPPTSSKKKIKLEINSNNVKTTSNSVSSVAPVVNSMNSPEVKINQVNNSDINSNSEVECSDSDSFIDPVMSPVPVTGKTKRPRTPKQKSNSPRSAKTKPVPAPVKTELEVKTEVVEASATISIPNDTLEPPTHLSQFGNRLIPATLSDLDGIDMMNLPVDLDDSNIDILDEINNKPELMQDTHANFLSLIRDIICSTMEHRMSLTSLEDRLKAWQENPISPLNEWYSYVDNWVNLLPSAINFLCGDSTEQPDDFVPYMEYKPSLQMYQWIGAGRDGDNLLVPLCQYWLDHRDDSIISTVNQPTEIEVDILEKSQTPPPPRCPTQWTVRKAEPEEIEEFRSQEQQRYSNPHKAFTYRMNGYESVVGPVKGIYSQSAGVSKARGHSMLNADRPNFVTILTLVRDATARLPNGEGTRADICELLKSSQYISPTAPENVLQSVVSGALDRMHTEFDPCVKYDTKRKIWIYLHRNRSEEDFERIHQQCQGMSKHMKKSTRKSKVKPKEQNKVPVAKGKPTAEPVINATPQSEKTVLKTFKTPVSRVFTVPTVQNIQVTTQSSIDASKTITVGSSLLVNSPKTVLSPKPEKVEVKAEVNVTLASSNVGDNKVKIMTSTIAPTKQDIEEAIQTFTPIRIASPVNKQIITTPKATKSLVKIINSPHGKSLIQPATAQTASPQQTVFIKQIDQKSVVNPKQILTQPQLTQQLLQSIAAQQKLKSSQVVQITQPQKTIVPTSTTPQIKTVQPIVTQIIQPAPSSPQITTQANISQQLLQAIQQKTVVTSQQQMQQQQLLQTLKQKVAQNQQQTVLTVQQAVLKQQSNLQQIQKQLQQQQLTKGTSLLGQQRIITQVATPKTVTSPGQTPLVAKVLTNAAGQVISVESLLAHQKQHGSLPQGTTLRVSGKPGQTNLIQLASTPGNQVAQFAVVSQSNVVSIAGQPRIVTTTIQTTTTQATVVTTAKTITGKNNVKPAATTKLVSSKLAQQFVNAKFIQNVTGNKIIPQQKLVVNQPPQIKISAGKPVTVSKSLITANPTQNTVRMVNAASINLAHIAGKPVLLASKGNTIQNIQGQNVIIQTQPSISTSGGSIVIPNNARVIQGGNIVTQQSQIPQSQTNTQVVLGPQLKVQNVNQNLVQANQNQVIVGGSIKQGVTQTATPGTVVLGGLKMQGTQQNQRVVLASQGQGGQLVAQQILLPPGFQGGAINIKTLQGLKVIPLAQTTQAKGRPQQVFARIMNPASATRVTQVTTAQTTSNQLETGGGSTPTDQ